MTAATAKRLPREARRRQLLEAALGIVRAEGADKLTLGYLAERAGVSKPVVYDHFATRSLLLIELYRMIDHDRVAAFQSSMAGGGRTRRKTVDALASAYILCAGNVTDEFHAVGAALAGSEDKARVFKELLGNCVRMFVAVLTPHMTLPTEEIERRCTALVGAGEALAAAMVQERFTEAETISTFAAVIDGAIE